jgi:3'(2'),5'-bisphosphate nucleotidase
LYVARVLPFVLFPLDRERMAGFSNLFAERALAEALASAVRAAGERIVACRAAGLAVETKADASPVTEADRQAERIILEALRELCPGTPVVAEEEAAEGNIPEVGAEFLLVDALDGTRDFLKGGDDFTVNVALVRDGAPVLGVVGAPARGRIWAGIAGTGAFAVNRRRVAPDRTGAHDGPFDIMRAITRTPETNDFIVRFPGARIVSVGSSLKFCTVAEGGADFYPRLGPTSQWDTAAGDAILRTAGGRVVTLDGAPLRYGPSNVPGAAAYLNPWFVATGGADPFAAGSATDRA